MLIPDANEVAVRATSIVVRVAVPVAHMTHRAMEAAICTAWVISSTTRRGQRSAMAPASGPSRKIGRNTMAAATPSQVVEPVMS
jgi:hypothetical protein